MYVLKEKYSCGNPNGKIWKHLVGSSKETKPMNLAGGSLFEEYDTGDTYQFNEDDTVWKKKIDGGGSVIIDEKEINENGTYNATDEGADGYGKVIVQVSGGTGSYGSLDAGTNNKTYYPTDYGYDAFDKVTVNIPIQANKTFTITDGTNVEVVPDDDNVAMEKVTINVTTSVPTFITNGTGLVVENGVAKYVNVNVPNELIDVEDSAATAGTITTNGTYNLPSSSGTNVIGFKPGFVVNVESGGGGLTFDAVMSNTIPAVEVPTSWTIPASITSIESYNGRDVFLDDEQKSILETISLASDHTGLTHLGESAFSRFSSLREINCVVPVDSSRGGSIAKEVFRETNLTEVTFNSTVKYMYDSCLYGLHSNEFESEDITNEEYIIGAIVYKFHKNAQEDEDVFTHNAPDVEIGSGMALYEYKRKGVSEEDTIYVESQADGEFSEDPEKEHGYYWWVHYEGDKEQIEKIDFPKLYNADGSDYTGWRWGWGQKERREDEHLIQVTLEYEGGWWDLEEWGKIGGDKKYGFIVNPELFDSDDNPYSGTYWKTELQEYEGNEYYFINRDDSYEAIECSVISHDDDDGHQFADSNVALYNLPNLVKVARHMFADNDNLESITLDSVTHVAGYAFANSGMQTLSLKHCEFFDCTALENCPITEIDFSLASKVVKLRYADNFPDTGESVTVKVPAQLEQEFRDDAEWQKILDRVNLVGV